MRDYTISEMRAISEAYGEMLGNAVGSFGDTMRNTVTDYVSDTVSEENGRVDDFYRDVVPGIRRNELSMTADGGNGADGKALKSAVNTPVSVDYTMNPLETDGMYYGPNDGMAIYGKTGIGKMTSSSSSSSSSSPSANTVGTGGGGGVGSTVGSISVSPWNGKGVIGRKIAHEKKHSAIRNGLSPTEGSMKALEDEYRYNGRNATGRFRGGSSNDEEMRTTNTELQYSVYDELRKRLGRKPTYDDYARYVDSMSDDEIVRLRTKALNGYDEKARGTWNSLKGEFGIGNGNGNGNDGDDDGKRVENIRRLLKSVTYGGRNAVGSYA